VKLVTEAVLSDQQKVADNFYSLPLVQRPQPERPRYRGRMVETMKPYRHLEEHS